MFNTTNYLYFCSNKMISINMHRYNCSFGLLKIKEILNVIIYFNNLINYLKSIFVYSI